MQIELTDGKDLFFYFVHELRLEDFSAVKDAQKLTCSWPEYLTVVQRLLVQTLREGTHFAILTKNSESQTAKLWFIMVLPLPWSLPCPWPPTSAAHAPMARFCARCSVGTPHWATGMAGTPAADCALHICSLHAPTTTRPPAVIASAACVQLHLTQTLWPR